MQEHIEEIMAGFRQIAGDNIGKTLTREFMEKIAAGASDALKALHRSLSNFCLDTKDQIALHRELLPEVLGWLGGFQLIVRLQTALPGGSVEMQMKWLDEECFVLQRGLERYGYLYHYYRGGCHELDETIFASKQPFAVGQWSFAEIGGNDFIAPVTRVFGEFRSVSVAQEWIAWKIETLKGVGRNASEHKLRWTGDVVNLVEVLYGLHLTGQINHSNISMNELVRWAESTFQVNIGIIQRKFTEIQRRKRISPTKYIDLLKESLLRKMDEENE